MRRKKLIELATAAGCKIQEEEFRTIISNKDGFAVAVYTDGSAHRADVDLSITKNMTIKQCADLLDLE